MGVATAKDTTKLYLTLSGQGRKMMLVVKLEIPEFSYEKEMSNKTIVMSIGMVTVIKTIKLPSLKVSFDVR